MVKSLFSSHLSQQKLLARPRALPSSGSPGSFSPLVSRCLGLLGLLLPRPRHGKAPQGPVFTFLETKILSLAPALLPGVDSLCAPPSQQCLRCASKREILEFPSQACCVQFSVLLTSRDGPKPCIIFTFFLALTSHNMFTLLHTQVFPESVHLSTSAAATLA